MINSQILINEFSASNSGNIVDPDYGNSADWIELYNAGDTPVNLNGYSITDNLNDRFKWKFAGDYIVEADGYLLIWADDMADGLHTNFKLSAEGEQIALSDAYGLLLDSLSYGAQESNISMGRVCDGCVDWVFFTEATPAAGNEGVNYKGLVQNEPCFYPLGGIFNSAVSVELKNLFPGEIRYTTDGSEPTINSPLFEQTILLDTTTIIRARIFRDSDTKPGKIITHSYFVDPTNEIGELPVISLVSEPGNFWDPVNGIYVQDFKPEWEIPVNIELFENDGSDRAGFNLPAGIKINGLYSWQLPQKMLGVYFRKRYGAGSLDYPLFFDKKATKYDSFALRASGNDWSKTLFRDGMLQNATQLTTALDVQGFRPCVVFINGKYMGIHNIRSKVDADFIVNEQLEDGTKIDMIENEKVVEEGSLTQYSMLKNSYTRDLSISENYDSVAALMDIPLFIDYMSTELYGGNSSIGHNVMAWKPLNYGKWKWIPVDLDRCMFDPDANLMSLFLGKTVYPFPNLMKNNEFAQYFSLSMADHLMTTFNPQYLSSFIDSYASRIEKELPRHIERWEGTTSSYGNPIPSVAYWEKSIAQMKTFAFQRPAVLLAELEKYGIQAAKSFSIGARPVQSSVLSFNSKTVPAASVTGNYPVGSEVRLTAHPAAGYSFAGWKLLTDTLLILKGDTWKYYDLGDVLSSEWADTDYDDSSWQEGAAELGYGDGDETTVVGYGSNSSNKYITTYFRKKLTIPNKDQMDLFRISIKMDDGAVIYVNGREAGRINMSSGQISYSTPAASSIPNAKIYQSLAVDTDLFREGENIIAVEIHQHEAISSDISFNMELRAGKIPSEYLSTNSELLLPVNGARSVLALSNSLNLCMLPDTISEEVILKADCSPYYSRGTVVITGSGKLMAEPGVEIRMAKNADLQVNGALQLHGSSANPIIITGGTDSWGAIVARLATDTLKLDNVLISNANKGSNPTTENAAISLFGSKAFFRNLTITDVHHNPILAKYSDVIMLNSSLHSKVTGDLINVKYGKAYIENCIFRGNSMPDTDAIDYDDVDNGVIKNSLFHDFHGFNSDAIDIGEQAKNILIDSVFIYNITDKGISVGQQSTVKVSNSYFVNCNLGIAAKDSTHVHGDYLTFYGCNIPLASYEKNIGSAGGNLRITRSILSNINNQAVDTDEKSTLKIEGSYIDSGSLPDSINNFMADPLFESPNRLLLTLKPSSPVWKNGEQTAGALFIPRFEMPVMPVISALYMGNSETKDAEYIVIENPGDKALDLSGYRFSEGIDAEIPDSTLLLPGDKIYLTNQPQDPFWDNMEGLRVLSYSAGRLNNSGEKLTMTTPSAIIVDQVNYLAEMPWPPFRDYIDKAIRLKNIELDNQFGYNWELTDKKLLLTGIQHLQASNHPAFYPNPASDYIHFRELNADNRSIHIFNLAGKCIMEMNADSSGILDVSHLEPGIYLLQTGSRRERLIIQR